ncbi:MAG: alpha/beta hydrolase [Planctomycetota bacterium]|jgi:esterase/lipase superfamily enzyme
MLIPTRLRVVVTCFLAAIVVASLGGCERKLMATPNLYRTHPEADPFDAVPPALRSNAVEVLYVTDRIPKAAPEHRTTYGFYRSPTLAYGSCTVSFGREVSWEDLVEASRSKRRTVHLPLNMTGVTPLGRWPADSDDEAETQQADARFRETIAKRLAGTDRKEVYIFVHGFNTQFRGAPEIIAQLWHFLGRGGVPIAYCWPSRPVATSLLRAYPYDATSTYFTRSHLKQLLRLLGSCPEVDQVHVIAHSRGAHLVMNSLREINLEFGRDPLAAREALKLGVVVLAAPDIDIQVFDQQLRDEPMYEVPRRLVIYVRKRDPAMHVATYLFNRTRLGEMGPKDLPDQLKKLTEQSDQMQVVDARISAYSTTGHSYFYKHPAVSSDLILVLRGNHEARKRPLTWDDGLWVLDASYPGSQPIPFDDDVAPAGP